jgi:hypothetical protein
MTNRGDLHAWSFKELLAAERRRDAFAIDATEIRAESVYLSGSSRHLRGSAVVAVASLFRH